MKRGLGSGNFVLNQRKFQRVHRKSSDIRLRIWDQKDKGEHEQTELRKRAFESRRQEKRMLSKWYAEDYHLRRIRCVQRGWRVWECAANEVGRGEKRHLGLIVREWQLMIVDGHVFCWLSLLLFIFLFNLDLLVNSLVPYDQQFTICK